MMKKPNTTDSYKFSRMMKKPNTTVVPNIPVWSMRRELVFLCFSGLLIVYLLRVNLNVAILAMTDPTPFATGEEEGDVPNKTFIGCPQVDTPRIKLNGSLSNYLTTPVTEIPTFKWTPYDQGIILSSFFYGYVISNLFSGSLAERFGGKVIFGCGILVTSLLTLLTPLAASISKDALVGLRVMEGLAEGVVFPSLHVISGRWIPISERASLYTFIHSGTIIGTVVAFPLVGEMIWSSYLGGWPTVFYVFGSLGILWFIFWWALMTDSPWRHPRISEEEVAYIFNNIENNVSKQVHPPISKLLTSRPVWAAAITALLCNWSFASTLNDFSTFLDTMLHYDIRTIGYISCLPHIMLAVMQWTAGLSQNFFIKRKIMNLAMTRKSFFLFGTLMIALFLFGAVMSECQRTLVVLFIIISSSFGGFCVPCVYVSLLDMAPNYGTLMGFVNAFGNIPGCAAPFVIGLLTNGNQTIFQWHKTFYISAVMSVLAGFTFAVFGSVKLQPWAKEGNPELEPLISNLDSSKINIKTSY